MKVICAWCQKIMIDSTSEDVSHGICEECEKKFIQQIKGNQTNIANRLED